MKLPKQVSIVEVGPRDGLQNEKQFVPTDVKVEFINQLSATGLRMIETSSFVSPKWIPQLGDASEVLANITRNPNTCYPVLIPNLKGLETALNTQKIDTIAVFTAASNTFNQKNINCDIRESLQRIEAVVALAKSHHIKVRAYISCVVACPYEGNIDAVVVANIAKSLIDMGSYEISLGDTIGVGNPRSVQHLIAEVSKQVALEQLAGHFHDTYGQALTNIYAALECGITIFDSSVSGLGGCPYAEGASGNVATEDVCYLMRGLCIETGVDLTKLVAAGSYIDHFLNRQTGSRVATAMRKKLPQQG